MAARVANIAAMSGAPRNTYTYYPPGAEFINESLSPPVKNRSHTITASMETDGKTDGVIVATGGYYSGYTLYVKNNIVTYTYNAFDENYYTIKANRPLAAGKHEVKFVYEAVAGCRQGTSPAARARCSSTASKSARDHRSDPARHVLGVRTVRCRRRTTAAPWSARRTPRPSSSATR